MILSQPINLMNPCLVIECLWMIKAVSRGFDQSYSECIRELVPCLVKLLYLDKSTNF